MTRSPRGRICRWRSTKYGARLRPGRGPLKCPGTQVRLQLQKLTDAETLVTFAEVLFARASVVFLQRPLLSETRLEAETVSMTDFNHSEVAAPAPLPAPRRARSAGLSG